MLYPYTGILGVTVYANIPYRCVLSIHLYSVYPYTHYNAIRRVSLYSVSVSKDIPLYVVDVYMPISLYSFMVYRDAIVIWLYKKCRQGTSIQFYVCTTG